MEIQPGGELFEGKRLPGSIVDVVFVSVGVDTDNSGRGQIERRATPVIRRTRVKTNIVSTIAFVGFVGLGLLAATGGRFLAEPNKPHKGDCADDISFHTRSPNNRCRASPSCMDPPWQYKFHPKDRRRTCPASPWQSPGV